MITVEGRQRRRREVLEEIFCCHGSTRTLREFAANHWHLRFEFAYSGEGYDLCTVTDKNTGLTKTVKCGSLQNPAGNGAQDQASASSQEVWMCTPTPYNGVPAAVPGKVEAEEYDDDGDCDGFYVPPYYEPKPDDPDIVYNYPEVLPVDLNAPDKEEKVAMVGGEWINYTISVTVAGEYRFAARVASAVDGESFSCEDRWG